MSSFHLHFLNLIFNSLCVYTSKIPFYSSMNFEKCIRNSFTVLQNFLLFLISSKSQLLFSFTDLLSVSLVYIFCAMLRRSVMSISFRPHALHSPWNSPGQDTGVGTLSLLQGIFPTQESNPGLPHCRRILYHLNYQGSPNIF